MMIYGSVNETVVLHVPKRTKRLLDVGCGTGAFGKKIKQLIHCEVIGITNSEQEAKVANSSLDKVLIQDLNEFSFEDGFGSPSLGKFDCIICSHVLEHLYQPEVFLFNLRHSLTADGILIVALPNVLFWKQRCEFLKGRFQYTDGGLMDKTHFRFFDWKTAQELVEQSGYHVIEAEADGNFPLPIIRKFLARSISSFLDRTAVQTFPGLFGFQFVFCCHLKNDA